MGLPIQSAPTYKTVLPSDGREIKFRPFLVKEQKVLMLAKEGDNQEESLEAVKNMINDVTFGDFAAERQVEVSGPDAFDFIKYINPRNLSKCDIGDCKYIVLTDSNGCIINDACLIRLEDDKFWVSPGDGDVLLWLQGVAMHSGMNVNICEPDVSPLQISGPKAGRLIQKLFAGEHDNLGYYKAKETSLENIPMVIARTGWSGELSYELYLQDRKLGNSLFELVYEAAKEFNGNVIAPNNIRTIEGGLLSYGSDFGREHNPFTIGLDRLVDVDQDIDFIGKEALKKIKENGTASKLIGVEMDGDPIDKVPEHFWTVLNLEGKKIGRLSRCIYSPRLKKNIGLAIVDSHATEEGNKVIIESPELKYNAIVAKLPWFPAEKDTNLL